MSLVMYDKIRKVIVGHGEDEKDVICDAMVTLRIIDGIVFDTIEQFKNSEMYKNMEIRERVKVLA